MLTCRPYRLLCDFQRVYDFLCEIYEPGCPNGMPAPFFEYAQCYATDHMFMAHRDRLWEDDGRIVAFAYFEVDIDKALLAIRPGYEALIPRMIDYAEARLRPDDSPARFWLRSRQTAARDALTARGYRVANAWPMQNYDFAKGDIPYALPEGYRFLDNARESVDIAKLHRCTWRGFDHGDTPDGNLDFQAFAATSPHFRGDLLGVVVNEAGEYVCFAGMWLDAPNRLAYLEPLCVVPECRRMGIGAATLAELVRRTRKLGCTHMTGGSNPFYTRLGFHTVFMEEIWEKE